MSAHSPSGQGGLGARLSRTWHRVGRKGQVAMSAGAVVLLALVSTGVVMALTSSHDHAAADGTTTSSSSTTTTTTRAKAHTAVTTSHLCPLTGTPASHGKVPRRPALGAKIGNDPASRPQSGLLAADIVYEEMAEGGITRYLAIFQCHVPAAIGPMRSVRWDDWHILRSYGHPILAFSGGISQWDDAVAAQRWIFDANGTEGVAVGAYYRTSNRVPPWNYYASPSALWSLDPYRKPPPPQFAYTAAPPLGATASRGATVVDFASGASVQWRWSARAHAWMRYVGGLPDVDVSGAQLRATNVIIEMVATRPGPYAESGTTPDVESITEGSGRAWILRNGEVESGTWHCARYGDLTAYRFADGKAMTLAPGSTWIELVPNRNYPVLVAR